MEKILYIGLYYFSERSSLPFNLKKEVILFVEKINEFSMRSLNENPKSANTK